MSKNSVDYFLELLDKDFYLGSYKLGKNEDADSGLHNFLKTQEKEIAKRVIKLIENNLIAGFHEREIFLQGLSANLKLSASLKRKLWKRKNFETFNFSNFKLNDIYDF